MYITVEPAGLMMHTVKLVFDPSDPAAEDQQVRDYLNEHELEPRYHWFAEIDGGWKAGSAKLCSSAAATWAGTCKTSASFNGG